MKIAIGGMQKNQMQQEIARVCPEVETVITNDMNAAPAKAEAALPSLFLSD